MSAVPNSYMPSGGSPPFVSSMNPGGGGPGQLETTSNASLNSLSPISTLEKQSSPPLGQRLILGIQVNAACCLEGGVEAILKLKGAELTYSHGNSVNTGGTTVYSPGGVGVDGGTNSDGLASINLDGPTGDTDDDGFDAFAFLHEGDTGVGGDFPLGADGTPPAPSSTSMVRSGPTSAASGKSNKPGFGGFLKKVAATTTAKLERSMQGLAVRIDQGRNPDLLRVAMYDPDSLQLLGVTETYPVPSERADIRFEVPLIVPGSRRQQQVLLKLWIQSGAALLQSAKAARNYLLGRAFVDCMKLIVPGVTSVPLASPLVVGGQLQLCIMPDPKFSPVLTRGWSLTDPDLSGYASNLAHLPLDQSYIFPGKQPQHWLVAHERSTESTVTLPLATAIMEMASKACHKSLMHAQSVSNILRNNRDDHKDTAHKATCVLGVVGVVPTHIANATSATISISWRRPDSIFELELSANATIPICSPTVAAGFGTVKHTFYPKLCTENILPGILQAYGGRMPASGFLLGGLYFCVTLQAGTDQEAQFELWETVLGMESFIGGGNGSGSNKTIQVPLRKHKDPMGYLLLQIDVSLPDEMVRQGPNNQKPDMNYMKTLPASDGLVSLVGMDCLADGVMPHLDMTTPPQNAASSLRQQQLNTMGYFIATQYMDQHLALRHSALESFQERARRYKQALVQPEVVEPHRLKTPKNFRPSSSRSAVLLSGIPFNVHVASLNVNVVDATRPKTLATAEHPGASFHNITCGAPSDHARGFGNVLANVSNFNVSGGLRRLEAKRLECAMQLEQAQSLLIAGVGNYLTAARKTGPVNHVPSRHAEIQHLRWSVFECVHNLHHVTWMCAVRRANVFSQSLGLAVSSYLASLSDMSKCAAGWPDLWKRHGFMVCFEGLLSAAGKELGMIEDASVAIAMLRMVRIVLMPDNGIPSRAVYIPSSPYLKWANIFTSGEGSGRHFLLQIGVDPSYYLERIPPPLQNNTAVQLYPVLYQVGVDIRRK